MRQLKHFLNNFELLRVNLNQNWGKIEKRVKLTIEGINENWGKLKNGKNENWGIYIWAIKEN